MSKWIIEKSPVMECPVFEEDLNFPLRNVYCVGRNYRDHAIEMGSNPDRDPPFFFQKTSDIILKDGETLKYPIDTLSLHYEVELVVFISKNAFQIKASEAKNIIFGYGVGVDITKRDIQKVAVAIDRRFVVDVPQSCASRRLELGTLADGIGSKGLGGGARVLSCIDHQ